MSSNAQLFDRAQRTIPGGVNSPVRAFRQVGGVPRFIDRAEGPYMIDAEGTRFIDYIGSWGPMIAGHAHPEVIEAVQRAATRSLSFGAPTADEIDMAEAICRLMPAVEMVRLVSSGTEAGMSAIRLARGFTGRDAIVKFEGCYHGHADSLLVKAGSGLLTFGNPSSGGVPADLAKHTLVLEFNNIAQIEALFAARGHEISCVMVEPIAGNMNFIRGSKAWHQRLRELCTEHGALLVWDEVMTGFRVALGGAQQVYGIKPDLVVMGKVIGGGMPLAAFGGRADVMHKLSPLGNVYQAGTLSGNPVAVAAGMAQLRIIQRPGFYDRLAATTRQLMQGLDAAAARHGITFRTDSEGGMFGFYFADTLPRNYPDVAGADVETFKRFFHAMLDRGVYLAPSMYEAGFVSAAHGPDVIAATLDAADAAFAQLAKT
ncbi:glutamate-1-semialdehyde aminotransferase (aminomutase) [Thiomonas sp. X19]|uniref:glutamate-1-semialdehyde 2,1-aminomutase n=1 Tax=Thiomonas sp. X19 TaxID=1050370 RepID=UPI000B68396D|nr:glutamate-1-semialdehyde 2,1-aminomutase [Thiomonas sp. X19]SCC92742.1 glutamate-1-semialdehyde aminotransferase (aminomutase) [Thiomonas sp. X19]